MASPCTGVCRLEGDICIGCARTLDEIGAWGGADDDGRRRILAEVARRSRP